MPVEVSVSDCEFHFVSLSSLSVYLWPLCSVSHAGEVFDYLVAHGRMKEKEARAKFRQVQFSYCCLSACSAHTHCDWFSSRCEFTWVHLPQGCYVQQWPQSIKPTCLDRCYIKSDKSPLTQVSCVRLLNVTALIMTLTLSRNAVKVMLPYYLHLERICCS